MRLIMAMIASVFVLNGCAIMTTGMTPGAGDHALPSDFAIAAKQQVAAAPGKFWNIPSNEMAAAVSYTPILEAAYSTSARSSVRCPQFTEAASDLADRTCLYRCGAQFVRLTLKDAHLCPRSYEFAQPSTSLIQHILRNRLYLDHRNQRFE